MIERQAKEIQFFFYSQAFADGLRAAAAILLPALAGMYTGYFEEGLTIALGAMGVSLTDAPGPPLHKRNGMLICAGLAFFIALLTSIAQQSIYTMTLEVIGVTFFFSMFTVYGNRATAVGNVAILIMILTMDKVIEQLDLLTHALLIFCGGILYMCISLMLYFLRPYRTAQRALGECIREVASYLSIRSGFYSLSTDLDEAYRKLFAQQVVVNEKQDAVREIFFKTRQIVEESTDTGRRLVFAFVETVDLFEDITATYYDYALLRSQFGESGALELIHGSLDRIVRELEGMGNAIHANSRFQRGFDYDEEVRRLKAAIDERSQFNPNHRLVLRKIVVNIRKLLQGLNNIQGYFEDAPRKRKTGVDHSHFVSHQSLDPKLVWDNLTLKSAVFRHAVRVSLACVVGFLVSKMLNYGEHSYWILLTIAFILKPAFSLTKQRNIQRIIGTLAGGLIGVLILMFIQNTTLLFAIMVVFMVGTYSFMRINYQLMVLFTTPYVLILFSLLGDGFRDVALERVLDTGIGCTIAFLVSYFLFPSWESEQLQVHLQGILRANAAYLQKTLDALNGQRIPLLEYKLARKNVYLNSANLGAAFQRMLSEPKSKQRSEKTIHQFVVLNTLLFSNVATVTTTIMGREPRPHARELVQAARKAFRQLQESARNLGLELPDLPANEAPEAPLSSADEVLMKEQLQFITQLSNDIAKTSQALAEGR